MGNGISQRWLKCVLVLGTPWGDEGKGKIVDLLTEQASLVVRFQGGHNAGHTLVIGSEENGSASGSQWRVASGCDVRDRQWCGGVTRGFVGRN